MNTIVEQFSGKGKRQEPILPPMSRASTPPPPQEKEAAQALAFMSAMNQDNVTLREDNARLRSDLNLALLRIRDLERERDTMRANLEHYRRYGVSIRNRLEGAMDFLRRAHDEALQGEQLDPSYGPQDPDDQQAETVITKTERELRAVAVEEIGKKYGANTRTDAKPNEPAK